MTQRPEYLRYLESAKQAELADQLRAQGFTVELDRQIGGQQFDLVAKKGDHAVAYEFKSGRRSRTGQEQLNRLQKAARDAGFEFHIVVVTPPPRVNIEIDRLSERLRDYLINERFPGELDSLSTHTIIDNVGDIEVSDIRVGHGEIDVEGTGTVEVTLGYGSGSESSFSSDAFPFHFSVTLSADGQLKSVEGIDVDTSSFYE